MKKHSTSVDSSGFSLLCQRLDAGVSRIVTALRKYKSALAAFLLPSTVRAIPEMIAGPYPIGWDTIAFYVPVTLDIAGGRTGVWGFVNAPLMYLIVVPIYAFTRINPIFIFK